METRHVNATITPPPRLRSKTGLNSPPPSAAPLLRHPTDPTAITYRRHRHHIIGHEISHPNLDSEGAAIRLPGRASQLVDPRKDLRPLLNGHRRSRRHSNDTYAPVPDPRQIGKQVDWAKKPLPDNDSQSRPRCLVHSPPASLKGSTSPNVDKFTGDQQFFSAFSAKTGRP